MAVKIAYREDRQMQTDSNGVTTFTHVMQLEGDSLMEIGTSRLLPQRGSRHPQNTAFYLDSIEITPNGNKNRGVQALATLTYSNGTELVQEFTGDPWELGAQNFTSRYIEIPKPFIKGYQYGETKSREITDPITLPPVGDLGKQTKDMVANVNSANCRIAAETTGYAREIGFTYCVRARSSGDFDGNNQRIINKSSETVAGIRIKPLTGLLLPQSSTFITEYDETGNRIKRQYWEISATIQISEEGWSKNELDIGTMCYFKGKDGKVIKDLKNIYSFTPWISVNPEDKIATLSKFGSIDHVIEAKDAYAKLVMKTKGYGDDYDVSKETDLNKINLYRQAWDELPYEEVTEPMPLREDGTLFEEAIKDPIENPYREIRLYDTVIGSWNAFDLPKKRA